MTKISLLLLFGALTSEGAPPSPSAAAGAKYEHKMENSNFRLGTGERVEVQGVSERFVGDSGSFMVDTVTGATLAVRNPSQSGRLPRPLTQDPTEHSGIVQDYLLKAGVPANEVSGTHVTTTMGGGGPRSSGVEPSKSTLLWYTTHLERSLQGIPVEGSFAYAALDSAGEVITEGVYWPAIPANVVSNAEALKQKLDSPTERDAFLANVVKARPDAKEATGEVKIVHTSAGHHGDFEARAVYSAVVRSPNRGKAQLVRFDDTGALVVLADERPSGNNTLKR